jgi:hypothetical protein
MLQALNATGEKEDERRCTGTVLGGCRNAAFTVELRFQRGEHLLREAVSMHWKQKNRRSALPQASAVDSLAHAAEGTTELTEAEERTGAPCVYAIRYWEPTTSAASLFNLASLLQSQGHSRRTHKL